MSECWNWQTARTEAPRGFLTREGSSPSSLTLRALGAVASATALHAVGRGFKSLSAHNIEK